MAKLGIALGSGPRGPGFESRHSDQKVLFSGENSTFSLFFSLKNVVKIDTFDLTTEIPQTDFYFDHRKGRPFQGGPSFLFTAAQDLKEYFYIWF